MSVPELDILLVAGPYLGNFELHPKHADLIRRHVAGGKLLFTTCTGASIVASTGVLDGKRATVNHVEYDWVKNRWPKVNWTDEKKWVIDGNIWTGSGAIAGMDMRGGHWLKENYGLGVLTQAASPWTMSHGTWMACSPFCQRGLIQRGKRSPLTCLGIIRSNRRSTDAPSTFVEIIRENIGEEKGLIIAFYSHPSHSGTN